MFNFTNLENEEHEYVEVSHFYSFVSWSQQYLSFDFTLCFQIRQ